MLRFFLGGAGVYFVLPSLYFPFYHIPQKPTHTKSKCFVPKYIKMSSVLKELIRKGVRVFVVFV